tara:strand:- start:1227 stop:1568 length:342 start_codon:yes stop_codon:yes gene_type:complete
MAFNELNSVEHYIIHQLSGVNLNATGVQEGKAGYVAEWEYKAANEIPRGVNEVLVESVEAELLYLIRKKTGKWTCFQNEIHFNNHNLKKAKEIALEIYLAVRSYNQSNPEQES